jgi:diguanylate cyclase (GGDEF)-like protein
MSSFGIIGLGFYLVIYFMVNLRTFVIVFAIVTLSLSGLAQANNSQTDDKKKVQVASLQEQKQEQLLVPNFSDINDLLDYKTQWLINKPENVLKAFQQFESNSLNTKPEQHSVQYTLALVDVYTRLSDFDNAITTLESIGVIEKLDVTEQIKVLEKKAQVSVLQANIFNANQFLLLANQLATDNQLTRQSIFTALSISDNYVRLADEVNSVFWQEQVKSLLSTQDDIGMLIEASIILAKQQETLGLYLTATKTLIHVIDLLSVQNFYNVEASLRIQLSHNFKTAEQYVNAEQELEKAYKLAVKSRNQQQQLMAIVNLIDVYIIQSKYDDALPLLKAAERLERFFTSAKDQRAFALVKAQVLAGTSQYSQALIILDKINTDDILAPSEKQKLAIDILTLKSKWLMLSGAKQPSIQAFEQLLTKSLTYQQHTSNLKLDFVMANYLHDLEQVKQDVMQQKSLAEEVKQQNVALAERLSNFKILLLLSFVALIAGGYFIYKRLQPKRTELQFIDPITGAHNHSYFVKHVNRLMQNDMPFSLVMFDVDNMRTINQKLGHELGDRLLTQIVERLGVRLGSNKLLVRLSGDRFIVIAKNFSLNQAFALAEILRKELNSNKFYVDNLGINLSASFGVTCHYENKTIDSMKDEVQDALNKAKTKGGNITQVVGFC